MWKNFSLMVEEAKMIVIGNGLCSRDGKKRKLLPSWKSYDGSGSGQGHDLSKYAADLETN
jgi:hypothetical protein